MVQFIWFYDIANVKRSNIKTNLGLSQCLSVKETPAPQVLEHSLKFLHGPQPPSTLSGISPLSMQLPL